jgi:hypothetical protein
MPQYAWSCLACGSSNGASTALCATCGCPAQCTTRDVERFRASHVSTGATVGAAAGLLRESDDVTGVQVLLCAAGLLVGIVPFGRSVFKAFTESPNAKK